MSSLPLGFLAPWQPKHDSLRMGATSLMKLTATLAAGAVAGAVAGGAAVGATLAGGATDGARRARAVARAGQRTQKQVRGRGMTNRTPEVNEAEPKARGGGGRRAGAVNSAHYTTA